MFPLYKNTTSALYKMGTHSAREDSLNLKSQNLVYVSSENLTGVWTVDLHDQIMTSGALYLISNARCRLS